jgi:2-methylisocitrate lyase-like PEP mutase family enzyme
MQKESLAVERVVAARAAIDSRGSAFVLTARTDAYLLPSSDPLETAIRRANRFREGGADCIFVPGVSDLASIRTLVREVDGPLNIVMGLGSAAGNVGPLLEAGVRRISLGGSIARSALGFVRQCARELRERGSIAFAAGQVSQAELNALFEGARVA